MLSNTIFSFLLSSNKKFRQSLKNILGFYPDNIHLYFQAFRHSSVAIEIKKGLKNSNERLEFLGDSVIGSIISEYLFQKYPFKDEGFLTKMKSKMVSRDMHNSIAVKLRLNNFIESSNIKSNGKSSILGDAYEALIGAIYLDKGYDFTKKFVISKIIVNYLNADELELKETDYKSKFIEWAQAQKKQYKFELVEEKLINNQKYYFIQLVVENEILEQVTHISKKKAEQLVAEHVCIKLEIS